MSGASQIVWGYSGGIVSRVWGLTDKEVKAAKPKDKAYKLGDRNARLASRFLALVAQRPGMVRHAEWSEFRGVDWDKPGADIGNALWVIPAAKMKQELQLREDVAFEHSVPLVPAAVEALRTVRILTGRGRYAFCSSRSGCEPMSENAIGYLYNREGYQGRHVPHGWRSSFSTIMNNRAERALVPAALTFWRSYLAISLLLHVGDRARLRIAIQPEKLADVEAALLAVVIDADVINFAVADASDHQASINLIGVQLVRAPTRPAKIERGEGRASHGLKVSHVLADRVRGEDLVELAFRVGGGCAGRCRCRR